MIIVTIIGFYFGSKGKHQLLPTAQAPDVATKKSFVELFIDDGKINVRLNTLGTEFAYGLSSLTDDQKFGLE